MQKFRTNALLLIPTLMLLVSVDLRAGDRRPSRTSEYPVRLALHTSFLSDAPKMSNVSAGFGGSVEAGIRVGPLEGFVHVERDRWLGVEREITLNRGVLNLGGGLAWYLLNRRVSISAAAGACTLLFDTTLDRAGQTGVFFDLRPATLRWPVSRRVTLLLTPLTFTLMIPVLTPPMLRQLAYRTMFAVEVQL